MSQDLILDLIKVILPSMVGYLAWVTRSLFKHERDLKAAFIKIRHLERYSSECDDQ